MTGITDGTIVMEFMFIPDGHFFTQAARSPSGTG